MITWVVSQHQQRMEWTHWSEHGLQRHVIWEGPLRALPRLVNRVDHLSICLYMSKSIKILETNSIEFLLSFCSSPSVAGGSAKDMVVDMSPLELHSQHSQVHAFQNQGLNLNLFPKRIVLHFQEIWIHGLSIQALSSPRPCFRKWMMSVLQYHVCNCGCRRCFGLHYFCFLSLWLLLRLQTVHSGQASKNVATTLLSLPLLKEVNDSIPQLHLWLRSFSQIPENVVFKSRHHSIWRNGDVSNRMCQHHKTDSMKGRDNIN